MKKQTKRLNLSKRTITNLDPTQMKVKVGGARTNGNSCNECGTQSQFTCNRRCWSF